MIRALFCVGLGGAAGSVARYLLSTWTLGGQTILGFPAGTFVVNAAGSLLIGILLQTLTSSTAGWLLITGFCGGFTTFSTFVQESSLMLGNGNIVHFVLYPTISFGLGLLAAYLGNLLAR